MSGYGIECSRCGGTILPGDGHALQHERTDVAELVKAARAAESELRGNGSLVSAGKLAAALKPFEGP